MNINTTRFFNHLMRRRGRIWTLTILLISGFATAGGAILWTVRMNVTYPAEVMPPGDKGWDGWLAAVIPATRFQSIRQGEPVIITLTGGNKLNGTIHSVTTGMERTKLKITLPNQPEETIEALITLRAERLISAFLHR